MLTAPGMILGDDSLGHSERKAISPMIKSRVTHSPLGYVFKKTGQFPLGPGEAEF